MITDTEVVEASVAFVGMAGLLRSLALLLGRTWRPLP